MSLWCLAELTITTNTVGIAWVKPPTDIFFCSPTTIVSGSRHSGSSQSPHLELFQCRSLEELFLARNQLEEVEEAGSLFPSLEVLDVRHNLLEGVAPLAQLGNLRELRLEGNPLCSSGP